MVDIVGLNLVIAETQLHFMKFDAVVYPINIELQFMSESLNQKCGKVDNFGEGKGVNQ